MLRPTIVGLLEGAIRESRERITPGFSFPVKRISTFLQYFPKFP